MITQAHPVTKTERDRLTQQYRCRCERGYVRCQRSVLKRGTLCDECTIAQYHGDGYHTAWK